MKKTILTIVITFVITAVAIFSFATWLGYQRIHSQPDFDKILTEEEVDKVLGNTVYTIGGDGVVSKRGDSESENFKSYSETFKLGDLEIFMMLDDASNWSDTLKQTFTDDPHVEWEDFIMKSYYKMVKIYAEAAYHNFKYYEDDAYLTKINGHDVEVILLEPYEEYTNYAESAKVALGNYVLQMMVKHDDKTKVIGQSEPLLKIFMEKLLEQL